MGSPDGYGWSGFLASLWSHEHQHFLNAENVLKQGNRNIYLELEGIVAANQFGAVSQVTQTYNQIQGSIANLGEPTGNWSTPFWLWTSEAANTFSLWASPNLNILTKPEFGR